MTTDKISYDQLTLELDKLYSMDIPADDNAIAEHCMLIANFISASGWSEFEYFERFLQDNGN